MHVRSLFAVLVAALLVGPATAGAQAKKATKPATAAPASSPKTAYLGGWIGYEMGDLDGLQLRGEYVMPYQKLSPQVDLSFVGSVGYSYLTFSESLGTLGDAESTANVLKFVPAARFSLPVNPQLSLFGDAGLGLYWASIKVKTPIGFGQTVSASDSGAGFMLRFGVGGLYKINPQMNIGASLVLDPMFGDYEDTTFSILAGLTYALK